MDIIAYAEVVAAKDIKNVATRDLPQRDRIV